MGPSTKTLDNIFGPAFVLVLAHPDAHEALRYWGFDEQGRRTDIAVAGILTEGGQGADANMVRAYAPDYCLLLEPSQETLDRFKMPPEPSPPVVVVSTDRRELPAALGHVPTKRVQFGPVSVVVLGAPTTRLLARLERGAV